MADFPVTDDLDQARKEQFAVAYAMCHPLPECLKIAGYSTTSPVLIKQLLHDPFVIEIVDATRKWAAEKLVVGKNEILQMLIRDRELAYSVSNPGAAAAIAGLIMKLQGAADPQTRVPSKVTIEWADEPVNVGLPE